EARFTIRHNDIGADRKRRQEDEHVIEPLAREAPWFFEPAVELRPSDKPAGERRRADQIGEHQNIEFHGLISPPGLQVSTDPRALKYRPRSSTVSRAGCARRCAVALSLAVLRIPSARRRKCSSRCLDWRMS